MDFSLGRRIANAVCLVVGPLAVAVSSAVAPTSDDGGTAATLQAIAAHQSAARVATAVEVVGILILPAIAALMGMAWRSPWLAGVGGTLAWLGFAAAFMGFVGTDILDGHAAVAADQGAATALVTAVNEDVISGVLVLVFVAGQLLGLILLGMALWRSKALPAWAAILVIVAPVASIALHSTTGPVGAIGWLLLSVAGIVAATRVLADPPTSSVAEASSAPTAVTY